MSNVDVYETGQKSSLNMLRDIAQRIGITPYGDTSTWMAALQQKLGVPITAVNDAETYEAAYHWIAQATNQTEPPELGEAVKRYGPGIQRLSQMSPEIAGLVIQAVKEGWDQQRVQGALQATTFFQTMSASQQQWTALRTSNPAEADKQVRQKFGTVINMLRQGGVGPNTINLTDFDAYNIAQDALSFGWDDTQLTTILSDLISSAHVQGQAAEAGNYGAVQLQIGQAAKAQMLPVDQATLQRWTADVLANRQTIQGIQGNLAAMAKAQRPDLAGVIDSGVTLEDYFAPAKKVIADTLELPDTGIDLNDPRWSTVTGGVDRPALNLAEVADYARRQPEYRRTSGANAQAATLVHGLLQKFGAAT